MTSHHRTRFAFLMFEGAAALIAFGVACSSSSDQNGGTSNDDGGDANGDGSQLADGANDANNSDGSLADAGRDSGRAEPSIQLAARYLSTCVLAGGIVKCWGSNSDGQLGIGVVDDDIHSPTVVTGIPFAPTMIAMGSDHTCASDGTHTSCWGFDFSGELADVDASACVNNRCPTALAVNAIGAVRQLALGDSFSCALGDDGGVRCFGYNQAGVLGAGASGSGAEPQIISGLGNVEDVGAGELTACARETDGTVWCWGENEYGELGEKTGDGGPDAAGTDLDSHPTPLQVPGLVARQLTVGSYNSCALLADNTVSCWGSNNNITGLMQGGQLGHDPATDPQCYGLICDPVASSVSGLKDVREVSTGEYTTCAVKIDDTVVCWGSNYFGTLGNAPSLSDGGQAYNFVPQVIPGLTNVAHVVSGIYHACAVTWDDHVLCWGDNSYGQLGVLALDGGASQSSTPVTPEGF